MGEKMRMAPFYRNELASGKRPEKRGVARFSDTVNQVCVNACGRFGTEGRCAHAEA
jgi:hypothetical protein